MVYGVHGNNIKNKIKKGILIMKINNLKMVNDSEILKQISAKELPIKVSYAIAKNIAKIDNELKIYNEERQKLVEKYGLKDNDGKLIINDNGTVSFIGEDLAGWNKDFKELLEIENDVNIHTFKLENLDGYTMTPSEFIIIDYMIEE